MKTTVSPDTQQQIAELIASYEVAMERLVSREKNMDTQYDLSEKFLNQQFEKISALITEISEVLTEAGAARMRLSMQEALKLGQQQIQSIQRVGEDTRNLMRDSCTRFERTAAASVKNINESINAVKIDDLKVFVEESYTLVKNHSTDAIKKVTQILKWFHWKNLMLALGVSVMTSVIIGLYLNAEWPWEIHQTIVKERAAGKAMLNAWPHLSRADQVYLEQKILKTNHQ